MVNLVVSVAVRVSSGLRSRARRSVREARVTLCGIGRVARWWGDWVAGARGMWRLRRLLRGVWRRRNFGRRLRVAGWCHCHGYRGGRLILGYGISPWLRVDCESDSGGGGAAGALSWRQARARLGVGDRSGSVCDVGGREIGRGQIS